MTLVVPTAAPAPQLTPAQRLSTDALTKADKRRAAERELASRVLAKRRLIHFTKRLNSKYDDGWVHHDIARRLEKFSDDVAAKKSPRLMLLVPPRHGKSELASRNFPPWHLGRNPDHEFIACSYNIDLARGFSRKVQQIIDDPAYQSVFETRLDPDNRSAESWAVHQTDGTYTAAGIGGPITGKGAHVLVIDDPIKNAEEADSADGREKIWEWYLSTAYSRLAPGGGVLIIQTWWHDDDLAGKLQQVMAQARKEAAETGEPVDPHVDMFEIVKYPAIAEADEYLDTETDEIVYDLSEAEAVLDQFRLLRRKGEALHPSRYDIDKLNRIRRQNRNQDGSDGRWWSALYQQNPVPNDGGYFTKDQFRRRQTPELSACNVFVTVDFAISEKKKSDYTVIGAGLQDSRDELHVADLVKFKSADSFFIVNAILAMCRKWYSPTLILGVEDGQIWKSIQAIFLKRCRELKIYPPVVVLTPITDKMARGRVLQGRMMQGMVTFSDKGDWYDECRGELLRFPAGVHDDQVDMLAWMAQLVVDKQPPREKGPRSKKSWRDRIPGSRASGSAMAA